MGRRRFEVSSVNLVTSNSSSTLSKRVLESGKVGTLPVDNGVSIQNRIENNNLILIMLCTKKVLINCIVESKRFIRKHN